MNVDHCATLRQARYRTASREAGQAVEPDPVLFALLAERAGADGITMHLREDRRHVSEADVRRARDLISTRLNLEMACTKEMIDFARDLLPDAVCLVPENREEVTTEGGLDVLGQRDRVRAVVEAVLEKGIEPSLFIDPDGAAIEVAVSVGAPVVELHTGAYANAYYGPQRSAELNKLVAAANLAHQGGLVVNLGHGINYTNIAEIMTVPHINELNIGHTLVSRALMTGVEEAVREMKKRMRGLV